MLYRCQIRGARVYVLAPNLRWVQDFCRNRLLSAGDRQSVPTITLCPVTNRELVKDLGLGRRAVLREWGQVEIPEGGDRVLRQAARRHQTAPPVGQTYQVRGITRKVL